ncbi:MAG: hypothetical protein IJW23_08335 [Lentisphaeria bacterium]|nr:hypothetical protein [Lentisphaeria bacterium]
MKCLSFEQIAAFVMDPAREENFEVMNHIFHCSECRQNYELALETCSENPEPLPGDKQLAKDATAALFARNSVWKKFQNFISSTAVKLQEQVKKGLPFLSMNQLTTQNAQVSFSSKKVSFAASSPLAAPAMPISGSLSTITFESEVPNDSAYYWKSQMAFPMMVSESAMITMTVQDKSGANLSRGTLLFLGKEFAIVMGRVSIPFKDFQNDRQCASIGVRFPDGGAVSGTIKFLPESFS